MWLSWMRGPYLEEEGAGGGSSGGSGEGAGGSGEGGQGGSQGGQQQGGEGSILRSGANQGAGAAAGGQGGGEGAAGAGEGGQAGGEGEGGEGAGEGAGEWYWSENNPGTGEAPPWFKADKYKTVDQQARAAVELEQKLGPAAELIGAPEDGYALPTPPKGVAGEFDPEDPLLSNFQTVAKELGLSQKAHDTIVNRLAGVIAEQNAAEEKALSDALGELGPNIDQRVQAVEQFVTNELGAEAYEALDAAIGNNVGAYRAIESLVARASGDAQLAGGTGQGGPAFNKQDVETEQYKVFPEGHPLAGKRMYEHDAEHRRKVDAMWKQLYPGDDVEVVGG